jgi:hypothetical protein
VKGWFSFFLPLPGRAEGELEDFFFFFFFFCFRSFIPNDALNGHCFQLCSQYVPLILGRVNQHPQFVPSPL